jgi:hypothetical protein
MLKQLFDVARQLLYLLHDTRENKEELKAQRREIAELAGAGAQLTFELERDRLLAAKEYENLVLRLELVIERFERRLPPPSN